MTDLFKQDNIRNIKNRSRNNKIKADGTYEDLKNWFKSPTINFYSDLNELQCMITTNKNQSEHPENNQHSPIRYKVKSSSGCYGFRVKLKKIYKSTETQTDDPRPPKQTSVYILT